ncbi:NmrA family NAD(P)-binding protein [Sphingomonas sp. CFBP 13714]|uniref:NmrA family NAD(P)-binding protein n=1 Tax=unclassified Sphingomonas TaxID=196159 RepID=UPI00177A862A|nr:MULTISPECIES: NmrA family NAD(P)-binding protein [unclassified Sphingomonas]MBD8702027.1 NmrA family NAD(P)-binding protein [Sphingomonas sp. CFBP 13714]MBD8737455.1 NmrA family NAD(P)-binding protein [Sphingomonas sp. CFBP 13706]
MTTESSPLIFLMGTTGQTGRLILEELDRDAGNSRIRIGVRKQTDLDRLLAEGRDAVLFDLDDPRTFGPALYGVDRMNILTGYTIAMTHQTKTVVDAAKKAGVKHIVNQGVFAADDATDSKYCWFALVEAYIEASGIAWTHLHPNVFLENMLSVSQPVGGTISTFWGENRVGYVALHDLAAVTAKVLRDGPERHGSKDYFLSTETMTSSELATAFSEVLDRPIRSNSLDAADMEALFKKGTVQVEDWYARSSFELLTQFNDGRMGYMGTVKNDVPYLLGRPAIGVRAWAEMHKAQLLNLVDQPSS